MIHMYMVFGFGNKTQYKNNNIHKNITFAEDNTKKHITYFHCGPLEEEKQNGWSTFDTK